MEKLYKTEGGELHYWEAWVAGRRKVCVHTGRVGDTGQTEFHKVPRGEDPEDFLESLAEDPLARGFQEIDPSQMWSVDISIPTAGEWPSNKELSQRHALEDSLNEAVGWIGAGHVDGGESGGGCMTVFVEVVDVAASQATILDCLHKLNILSKATVTASPLEGDDSQQIIHRPGA
ncbi:MAG: hypothetical protein ACIAS6_11205 [Phycisphaerales bacterium JB060]